MGLRIHSSLTQRSWDQKSKNSSQRQKSPRKMDVEAELEEDISLSLSERAKKSIQDAREEWKNTMLNRPVEEEEIKATHESFQQLLLQNGAEAQLSGECDLKSSFDRQAISAYLKQKQVQIRGKDKK